MPLIDDVRRATCRAVRSMCENVDAQVRVHQKSGVWLDDDGLKGLVYGPGSKLVIEITVPPSAEQQARDAKADTVSVEILRRCEWNKAKWSDLKPGDIVRFRDPDGCLQEDPGFIDPETLVAYSRVRDWRVLQEPRLREHTRRASSVQVEPHDFDLATTVNGQPSAS